MKFGKTGVENTKKYVHISSAAIVLNNLSNVGASRKLYILYTRVIHVTPLRMPHLLYRLQNI